MAASMVIVATAAGLGFYAGWLLGMFLEREAHKPKWSKYQQSNLAHLVKEDRRCTRL